MKEMRLTKNAQTARDDLMNKFQYLDCACEYDYVCKICLHEGNPEAQRVNITCWERDVFDIDYEVEDARCRLVAANYSFWALQKLEMLSVFHDAMVRLELRYDQKADSIPE